MKTVKMEKPILKVSNLSVATHLKETKKFLLKKVNLAVNRGDIFGLIGETGSGKSMLGWSLINLLPKGCFLTDGSVVFGDKNISQVKNLRGKKISMIFQDPMHALNPTQTIGKQMKTILTKWHFDGDVSVEDKIFKWINKVQLNSIVDIMDRYPHQLSGGQIQRVMIALAMSMNPKIVIADEITTGLDASIKLKIMDLLFSLHKENDVTTILISHDLALIRRYCNQVAVMRFGKIITEGKTDDIFIGQKNEYVRLLITDGFSEKKSKTLTKDSTKRIVLSVKSFSKAYGDNLKNNYAVRDVSINLCRGKTLGLVGESGSGKSTLAKMILNILDRDFGQLELIIDEIIIENLRIPSREIGAVLQDSFGSLNPRMNSYEILLEPLELNGVFEKKIIKSRIKKAINDVGLNNNVLMRYPHLLSGGQRQRLSLARAMIMEPKIIVLDEPTSALDLNVQKKIIKLLKSLQKEKNLSYLFISHDLSVISEMADDVAVLYNGEIIETGITKNILNNPEQDYTKKLIESSLLTETVNL